MQQVYDAQSAETTSGRLATVGGKLVPSCEKRGDLEDQEEKRAREKKLQNKNETGSEYVCCCCYVLN